jgi:hypothetical protein
MSTLKMTWIMSVDSIGTAFLIQNALKIRQAQDGAQFMHAWE